MGKLQAFVIFLGIGFNDFLFDPDLFEELFCLLVVLTRGTGFTGFAIEILLLRSASLQRVALVQKTVPSDFVHLIGVAVLRTACRVVGT